VAKFFPEGYLDSLRAKISLAKVAGETVEWDQRKSNTEKGDLWAPCPFHAETTASFHVDDRQGFYYCFGCHAKGDVISFVRDTKGLNLRQAALVLAEQFGLPISLNPPVNDGLDFSNLLDVKDFVVKNFEQEHFLELGVVTGWNDYIKNHPRLLRSLSWGDSDFPGCVMELLTNMDAATDGSIGNLHDYIEKRFSAEKAAAVASVAFQDSAKHLGYRFESPRNDVISVMMPFSPEFLPVYEAIKDATAATPLDIKRADEVWESSVLINDILSLINHSAVVICDLTGRNENVFYELGIAHAWGKPVIPVTQNSGDVPFDLKHHRFLSYLNNAEGRKVLTAKLEKRLVNLVGSNPFF